MKKTTCNIFAVLAATSCFVNSNAGGSFSKASSVPTLGDFKQNLQVDMEAEIEAETTDEEIAKKNIINQEKLLKNVTKKINKNMIKYKSIQNNVYRHYVQNGFNKKFEPLLEGMPGINFAFIVPHRYMGRIILNQYVGRPDLTLSKEEYPEYLLELTQERQELLKVIKQVKHEIKSKKETSDLNVIQPKLETIKQMNASL